MIGNTFGHYQITEKLGEGGMGVVYKARDEHLQRDVAVKVLPSGTFADDAARKRFRKEALALSKLSHPNIETVHDFDTQDGIDFLVMEFIPGQTLDKKLAGGPLPEKEVSRLGTQLAEGLAAAHDQGVVHRDLKPGNLLVTLDGRLKILDYGLAKFLQATAAAMTTDSLTESKGILGTLPYMAPEQLRGERLDARVDIWAAGVVLYEMATGRRPFDDPAVPRLTDDILHSNPTHPVSLQSQLSSRIAEIILRCLEKDPQLRYQTARDLLADLRRLGAPAVPIPEKSRYRLLSGRAVLAIAGIAVVALTVVFVRLRFEDLRMWKPETVGGKGIRSLAVLPLANLSGDREQEYFCDGMTDALITELYKLRALKVISRTSVMQYKGTKRPLPQIARDLGVDALVEGSVLKAGERVRINVQLIRGSSDEHVWAENYDGELKDILGLQSEVAQAIARAIKVSVTPEERSSFNSAARVNPVAYEYYLRGKQYGLRTQEEHDIRIGIQMYEKAIETDPAFAQAYAALAQCHGWMWWFYYDRTIDRVNRAKAAADAAFAIAPNLPETHAALGHYHYICRLDYPSALREYKASLEMQPNNSDVISFVGYVLRRQGKMEEALAAIEKALALDPLSGQIAFNAGETCGLMRKPGEADRFYDLASKLVPDWPRPYAYKARHSLRLTGDTNKAETILKTAESLGLGADPWVRYSRTLTDLFGNRVQEAAARLSAESWDVLDAQFWFVPRALLQAQICGLLNRPQEERKHYQAALKLAQDKARQRPDEALYHSTAGIAYAGLGRKQEAIREGQKAVEMLPVSREAYRGFYREEDLARILVMVGEYEKALDRLEYLMSIAGDLGGGALRLDPVWAPLRSHPRFHALVNRYSQ